MSSRYGPVRRRVLGPRRNRAVARSPVVPRAILWVGNGSSGELPARPLLFSPFKRSRRQELAFVAWTSGRAKQVHRFRAFAA
eukprot:6906903-Alexandrium_andersonii.AAC.1